MKLERLRTYPAAAAAGALLAIAACSGAKPVAPPQSAAACALWGRRVGVCV